MLFTAHLVVDRPTVNKQIQNRKLIDASLCLDGISSDFKVLLHTRLKSLHEKVQVFSGEAELRKIKFCKMLNRRETPVPCNSVNINLEVN